MAPVLVIGAGPGGCAAALVLARAGLNVTLVEQSRFPRDKVCGECISALGWTVLKRLGLADTLLAAGAVPLRHAVLYATGTTPAAVRLPEPMYGISRSVLDAALLDAAKVAAVEVLQPARCEGVRGGEPPAVTLRSLNDNAVTQRHVDYVVVAEGKSALLGGKPPATADLGLKAHFVDVDTPPDAIGLFSLHGHYVGVAPIEGGRFNLAFSIPRRRIEGQSDLDVLFEAMLDENEALRRQFARARRVSPWLTSALPRFAVREDWPDGVIPVGNAAAALEPIGGEGIGLALRSGELAAKELAAAQAANRKPDVGRLRREFAYLWRLRRASCRAAALCLSNGGLAAASLRLIDANALLGRAAMALMGKRTGQSRIA